MSSGPPMPPMPPGMKAPPMPPGFSMKGPPMPPGMARPPPMPPPMPPAAVSRAPPLPPNAPPPQPSSHTAPAHTNYLTPNQPPPMPGDYNAPTRDYPPPPSSHYDEPYRGRGGGPVGREPERYGRGGRGGYYDDAYDRGYHRGRGGRGGHDRFDRFRGRGGGRGFRGADRDRGGDRGGRGRYSRGGYERGGHGGSSLPMRDPTNTVWVGSLDPVLHRDQALREAFGEFGKVMQIARHDDRGYCFVHFRTVEEAKTAVDALTHLGTLGPAVYNYGKMYEYTPEQMAEPYDPESRFQPPPPEPAPGATEEGRPARRHGREDDAAGPGAPPPRRARHEKEPMEPSNILWVGSLPPFMTDEKLHDLFDVFGEVTQISRMDRSNIAFVHFGSVDSCTTALQTMSGRPIEGGVVLALNYGHPQRTAAADGAAGGAGGASEVDAETAAANEVPTNVIYLGSLPADTTEADIDALFAPYEGFLSSKYVAPNGIAFGHFTNSDTARSARIGLHNTVLHGVPIRVNFGKHNHRQTVAGAGGEDGLDLDALMRQAPGDLDGVSGALVAGGGGYGGSGAGALTLPAQGSQGGAGGRPEVTAAAMYERERPAPEVTLDARLQSVIGTTYNSCGAQSLELSPSQIQAICTVLDRCVDEASAQQLDSTLTLYCPQKAVHVLNITAKRMHECYQDDPHKRLLVLYAATRVVLGVRTPDYDKLSTAALNAYLMVLLVASQGQTASGLDRLTTIIEGLGQSGFIANKSNAGEAYEAEFREQLKDILSRAKAEQDLNSLLKKKRRR